VASNQRHSLWPNGRRSISRIAAFMRAE
jgi:hypothetical protein